MNYDKILILQNLLLSGVTFVMTRLGLHKRHIMCVQKKTPNSLNPMYTHVTRPCKSHHINNETNVCVCVYVYICVCVCVCGWVWLGVVVSCCVYYDEVGYS